MPSKEQRGVGSHTGGGRTSKLPIHNSKFFQAARAHSLLDRRLLLSKQSIKRGDNDKDSPCACDDPCDGWGVLS